jgi:hypothetical protein
VVSSLEVSAVPLAAQGAHLGPELGVHFVPIDDALVEAPEDDKPSDELSESVIRLSIGLRVNVGSSSV